jgi:hypothetical protein
LDSKHFFAALPPLFVRILIMLKYSCLALLSATFTITPVYADSAPQNQEENAPLLLEYRINNNPAHTLTDLEKDPLASWLSLLQQSAQVAKESGQPANTEVRLRGGGEFKPFFDELPAIQLETAYGADDKGHTLFSQDSFNFELKEKDENGRLEWQGLQGHLDFSGDLLSPAFVFTLPGMALEIDDADDAGDKVTLNFSNLNVALALDSDNEPSQGKLTIASLNMRADNSLFSFKNVRSEMSVKELFANLKVSDANFDIEHVSFSDHTQTEIAADKLHLSGSGKLNEDAQTIAYLLNMSVERLRLPRSLSESGDINYRARLSLDKFDAAALAELQKTLRNLRKQNMPQEMIGLSMMGKLIEILPALVAQSPHIELNEFSLNTAKGRLQANAKLSVDGDKPLDFSDPTALTQILQGHAKLRVSRTIVEDALRAKFHTETGNTDEQAQQEYIEKELLTVQEEGFLIADGEDFTFEAKFSQGRLLVNGKEFALDE